MLGDLAFQEAANFAVQKLHSGHPESKRDKG